MKVLVVVGTRPEAIKMAPLVAALEARRDIFDTRLCVSGQHRDMMDSVIHLFGLTVHYDLNVMVHNQSVADITTKVLTGVSGVLEAESPDVVLIHGDTTTSFAAALAAHYHRAPVGHVEAGLRTHDKWHPFPEEMNRRLADALCDYHYAPTERARENLLAENIPPEQIVVTGNTAIDALLWAAKQPCSFDDPFLERAGADRRLILVTAHRRESFGAPFREMCSAMRDVVNHNDNVEVIYPMHPNPNVRKAACEILRGHERIRLVEPLGYLPFVQLQKKAYLILTDSGGIQEEAPSLGTPVLVMRDTTERPEAVDAGVSKLVGTKRADIAREVQQLLDKEADYNQMASAVNPFGDGHASERIAGHLADLAQNQRGIHA